jgi:hypothetical protein
MSVQTDYYILQMKIKDETISQMAAEITKLRAERDAMRKLITDFLAGDYEPRIKKSEKCAHGQYGYEACEACIEEHFSKGLALLATDETGAA